MKIVFAIPFFALLLRFSSASVASSVFEDSLKSDGESVAIRHELPINKPLPKPADVNSKCEVKNKGGVAISRPCCVVTAPNRVDCFVRGAASTVWQKTMSISADGGDSEWVDLGGGFINDVECVSRYSGTIDILAIGEANCVFSKSFDSTEWSQWNNLGGIFIGSPVCASSTSDTIDCVLQGTDNGFYRISFKNGKWCCFSKIDTKESLLPMECGVLASSARIDWFTVIKNQKLYQVWVEDDKWQTFYQEFGVSFYGRLSVVWSNATKLGLYGLGIHSDLQQITWDGLYWVNPTSLGGTFTSDPVCLALGKVDVHCFGISVDSQLYHSGWDGAGWSEWEACSNGGGGYIGPPSCVASGTDRITCYARDGKLALIQFAFRF